jgi:Ca2+-binding RTX toxin-like protein
LVKESSYVTVKNSEFSDLRYALSHLKADHLTVEGNYFHTISEDGVRGGDSDNVTISQNFFTDFRRYGAQHVDAIQFWTNNTTATTENINISGNVIWRGSGAATAMDGISLFDENTLGYSNVTISDNFVAGTFGQGISVEYGNGIVVSDNLLVAYPDMGTSIRFIHTINGEISNNLVNNITTDAPVTNSDNIVIAPTHDLGVSQLNEWLAAHGGLANLPSELLAVVSPPVGQTLTGTAAAESLTVDSVVSTRIDAGDGADTLTGGAQANVLVGGLGDDTYVLGPDVEFNDLVLEGTGGGIDTVLSARPTYTAAANVEQVDLLSGAHNANGNELDNIIHGNADGNMLKGFHGADVLYGMDGADTLNGGDDSSDIFSTDKGADTLDGGAGNDALGGGYGNDLLLGGAGNDNLEGGFGDDTLIGGLGQDTMSGRGGADLYILGQNDQLAWNAYDSINGFNAYEGDRIDLSGIDANINTVGDDAFTYIGKNGTFTHVAGQLRFYSPVSTMQADLDGDGTVDYEFKLANTASGTPVAGNFIL